MKRESFLALQSSLAERIKCRWNRILFRSNPKLRY